jgi:hypothetical protein
MPPKDVDDRTRGNKDENNKNREMFFSPLGNFFIALCIFLLYQERVQSQLKQ